MHLKGSPKGDAKVRVYLGDQAKVPALLHQVLLLEIIAAEHDTVEIFLKRK